MKKILFIFIILITSVSLNAQMMSIFDGEKAFRHLETILSFGPRITGTEGHKGELDYIENELVKLGYKVKRFEFRSQKEKIKHLNFTNIYTVPDTTGEIRLFSAHLDTLPHCPRDPDVNKRHIPLTGANDGASGVAFLLELARVNKKLGLKNVAFAFFDGEEQSLERGNMFAGSTHMAENIKKYYSQEIEWMILVDMIGDRDLELKKERHSKISARAIVDEIWETGEKFYPDTFNSEIETAVLDDHIPFIKNGIPAIDIIDFDYPVWHTTEDTIEHVSSSSLQKLGVVLEEFLRSRK